ncbi:hypothetical protein [Bacillus cereus]|nr:hypothetical protein [Bacillus cereus]KAB2468097.1 hypothetical protein F8164_08955 [Bacillus cereus]
MLTLGFIFILLFLIYHLGDFLYDVISGAKELRRVKEEKNKNSKEKILHLRKTSYRRGVR